MARSELFEEMRGDSPVLGSISVYAIEENGKARWMVAIEVAGGEEEIDETRYPHPYDAWDAGSTVLKRMASERVAALTAVQRA